MLNKKKLCVTVVAIFLVFSAVLLYKAAAAGIMLNPTTQAPGSSTTVSGTAFGASKAVCIGFGAETAASESGMAYSGTGTGPYSGKVSNVPIKPGSFVLTSDTTMSGGQISTYTDNGDGTLSGSFAGATGTINYATGDWSRVTTADLTGLTQVYSATYTRYQYNNLTSVGSVTTSGSGAFSKSVTVPSVAAGTYTITAVDSAGNIGTAPLTVSTAIPEGFPVWVMMVLAGFAVVIGSLYLGKQPKIRN